MAIEAFVFDCGGVLLQTRDQSFYTSWERRLGLASGELMSRLWESDEWRLAESGAITEAEYWQRSALALGLDDDGQAAQLRDDLWSSWQLDGDVLDIIDSIRQRFRVAMLSNATDALENMLATRYQVADRFEAIVNSARVGVAKPEEAIYTELLRRLELDASQVVFVDDRAENVAAAASLGMHVVWYIGACELKRQLAGYLGQCRGGVDNAAPQESAEIDAIEGSAPEPELVDQPE